MSSSNTPASTTPLPAPCPAPLRGHIGDLPHDVLKRILVWKLLANGGLSEISNFIKAAPFLSYKVGIHVDVLADCGINLANPSWDDDIEFWQKFIKLRRYQKRMRC